MFNKINSNCRQLPSLPSVKSVRQFYVLRLTRRLQMLGGLVSTKRGINCDVRVNKDRFRKTVVPSSQLRLPCRVSYEWFCKGKHLFAGISCGISRKCRFIFFLVLSLVRCLSASSGDKLFLANGWRDNWKEDSCCRRREIFNVCKTAVWSKWERYVYLCDQRGLENTDYCTDESGIF